MLINQANEQILEAIIGCERLASGKACEPEVSDFICDQLRLARRLRLDLIGTLHGIQGVLTHDLELPE